MPALMLVRHTVPGIYIRSWCLAGRVREVRSGDVVFLGCNSQPQRSSSVVAGQVSALIRPANVGGKVGGKGNQGEGEKFENERRPYSSHFVFLLCIQVVWFILRSCIT